MGLSGDAGAELRRRMAAAGVQGGLAALELLSNLLFGRRHPAQYTPKCIHPSMPASTGSHALGPGASLSRVLRMLAACVRVRPACSPITHRALPFHGRCPLQG